VRVFGFAGWSGSGKTTLIERLIPCLVAQGLSVALVKHAHHEFDIDHLGKDSHRHRVAGCQEVLITSAVRWALIHELRGAAEMSLEFALARLSPVDLVLVEGFKVAAIPKLEIYRASVGKALLHPGDTNILAVASDVPLQTALPTFALNDIDALAAFVRANARHIDASLGAATSATPDAGSSRNSP
jgi:molybdopterin-guanine dinucleotide biosynthesis adapter protein